jgi:GrpB-like predicted nucleotidyltransferase (UPF0157 family)
VRTPARDVHLHLLRDHLRTDPEDLDLYEHTKRALMEQDWADMNAYADAKTAVMAEIEDRVRSRTPSRTLDAAPRGCAVLPLCA